MPPKNFTGLRADVQRELRNLDHLTDEAQLLITDVSEQSTFREIRAAGSILHDFYTAIERIFQRIALEVDGDLPGGPDWHVHLLLRMAAPVEEIRPPVVSEQLREILGEYLRFRHLFRHVYGFELQWKRCSELLSGLPLVLEQLRHELGVLDRFLESLA
jgi:hypothetical protein